MDRWGGEWVKDVDVARRVNCGRGRDGAGHSQRKASGRRVSDGWDAKDEKPDLRVWMIGNGGDLQRAGRAATTGDVSETGSGDGIPQWSTPE